MHKLLQTKKTHHDSDQAIYSQFDLSKKSFKDEPQIKFQNQIGSKIKTYLSSLAFILACFFMTWPGLAQAAQKTVDLSLLSESVQKNIYKQFPILSTEDFTSYDLDALIRFVILEEQFDAAQIQMDLEDGVEVYKLNVGKTRRISALKITGNQNFSESEIRREFAMSEKSLFDQNLLIEAGERVRRMYNEAGFANTVVDLEFARASSADVEVTIKIQEGPQTIITSINLRASNPEFKKRYQEYLNKKLKDEPLTEALMAELRKDSREDFSDRRYYKAELSEPKILLNKDESQASMDFLVDRSEQYTLVYEGDKQRSRSKIERALNISAFFSSNPNIAPELAGRIKSYYLTEGFARAEVSAEEGEDDKPYKRVIRIKINEGPRVEISEIRFSGRFSEDEKFYVKTLENLSSELIQDGYYNREDIESGIKNLVIDRQNQGFLRAKIVSVRTTYNKERTKISILVNMDEGPLTQLENVSFEGNNSFSEAQLFEAIGLESGRPLKLNELEESIQKLKNFYKNSGYLEMTLINEKEDLITYNEDNTLARVKFKVLEGPQVTVATILLEGNSLTKDYVIMKELDFKVGDILTPQLIEESVSRLQRLGHFNTVEIKTLEERTQIGPRTVLVRVADRDPGVFTFGVGANNERKLTLRGYTGVAYRNIMGTGRGASVRLEGNYNVAQVKYLERKITLGYLEPYLFNTRIRGRANYTQSTAVSQDDTRQASEVKQITYSLEQDITSHLLVIFDVWNSAQIRKFAIADIPGFSPSDLTIVSTGPTLELDYRDHPFIPTKGTFTRFNFEYASPNLGSSDTIEYYRTIGSFTHYYGFAPGWVFANSIRGGYLENLQKSGGVPYDIKGLILGGQSTVRGFEPGESFPNRYDFGVPTDQFSLTTSANMYLLKSELRFPIYGNIGGAVFYDGGAVYVKGVNIADPYRDTAGIAFRYSTPVGAVSLEWAYKLDRKSDRQENQWPFSFSIGTF